MRRTPAVPRLGWPLILLLLGLGCIALALLEAQRSMKTNRTVAERALRGYASFAAWSYEEHLSEALRLTTREVLGAVNHGTGFHTSPTIPSAADLGHTLPWDVTCACHRTFVGPLPREFFGFTLGADTIAVGRNLAPHNVDGWLVDPVPETDPGIAGHALIPVAVQRWLHDTLTQLAHGGRSPWGYDVLAARMADSSRFFAMTIMPTSWGDTIVYAAEYPPAGLDSLLQAVLDSRGLLPEALITGRRNRDILAVQVSDAFGRPLFSSGVPAAWSLDATTSLPATYGGMTVRVQIQPALADKLVIGGLPRSRLPLLLVLLALAAGLTVTAVLQLRREARFARDREAFVANVSHELRTPLAQIRLVTDTLRLGREPDAGRREAALSLVDREVTRLQHLIESVLRFTRGGRTDTPLPPVPVDVVEEVRTAVAEFAPLAAPRGTALRCVTSGAPVVRMRAGTLRQVLLNLLDNAVKYGPSGQTVTVQVEPGPDNGARLTVTDEGPGIPDQERLRIWQPFERGSAAGAVAVGGSGIGLTVVREIVESHGGSVSVNGGVGGRGAAFVVDLPGNSP